MRRTHKWQTTLTLNQLRHLRDMKSLGLAKFKDLRSWHRRTAVSRGCELWEMCPECHEIERRLKAAGHKFDEKESH